MKKYIFLGVVALFIILLCSCVHLGDLNLDPIPDIGFSIDYDGLTMTFTSTTENTSDIKWAINDGSTGTGETFLHSFTEPGEYWVVMTGMYEGAQQSVSAKILVAKAAKVNMNDETVADWENVTYPDFQFTGSGPGSPIVKAKIDYDANYVYYYMEFDVTSNPIANEDSHILSVSIDADDDTSTGMSTGGVGAEYLMEGNLYDGWYDFYEYSTSDDDWTYIEDPNFYDNGIVIGHQEVDGNIMKIEWAYSRSVFGFTSTSYSFYFKAYDEDWNDADILQNSDGSNAIHIMMDKKE